MQAGLLLRQVKSVCVVLSTVLVLTWRLGSQVPNWSLS